MSVATTLRPPAAIFREDQFFAWWVYVLLAVMVVLALALPGLRPPMAVGAGNNIGSGASLGLLVGLGIGLGLPTVLVVGVLRMTTEVTPTELRVWFGWLPTYRKAVPISLIRHVEVVTYRPLVDCGGWGIRSGPEGERVLNARGNRGVRVWLTDGSRLLIGSQRPEELAGSLLQAVRPCG